MSARFFYRAEWTCDRCGEMVTIESDHRDDLPEGWMDHQGPRLALLCPACADAFGAIYLRRRVEEDAFWGVPHTASEVI